MCFGLTARVMREVINEFEDPETPAPVDELPEDADDNSSEVLTQFNPTERMAGSDDDETSVAGSLSYEKSNLAGRAGHRGISKSASATRSIVRTNSFSRSSVLSPNAASASSPSSSSSPSSHSSASLHNAHPSTGSKSPRDQSGSFSPSGWMPTPEGGAFGTPEPSRSFHQPPNAASYGMGSAPDRPAQGSPTRRMIPIPGSLLDSRLTTATNAKQSTSKTRGRTSGSGTRGKKKRKVLLVDEDAAGGPNPNDQSAKNGKKGADVDLGAVLIDKGHDTHILFHSTLCHLTQNRSCDNIFKIVNLIT